MDTPRTSRPIPLGLTVLVALFSALAALAVSNGHDARAHGSTSQAAEAVTTIVQSSATLTQKQAALRTEMQHLSNGLIKQFPKRVR